MARTGESIIVLGGINMDLVTFTPRFPLAGETIVGTKFVTYPGGKGANQAVAASRSGGSVYMIGRVGNDDFGPQLISDLNLAGVNTSGVGVSDTNSGIAIITIDDSSQNQIIQVLGANDTCGETESTRIGELIETSSTLLLQLEVSIDLSLDVAKLAHKRGKTVILDPSPVRPFPEDVYHYCSVITPNETDAEALVGFVVTDLESAELAAMTLINRGVPNVIIKLGEQGALYANTDGRGHIPAFSVTAVDSVGAGDAFNGALAVALSEDFSLRDATRFASAAGALAVTKVGAQDAMPNRSDIDILFGHL
ncbi:MAG: ribokinase [Chloroflexota bacterium]|nr:ribokinase [Chloroflexota bacterium]